MPSEPVSRLPREPGPRLPWLLWVVMGSTFVTCIFGEVTALGFNLRGWMWLVPLALSLVQVLNDRARRPFPLVLWVPWTTLCVASLVMSPFENALQRTAMALAPLPIAYACSGLPMRPGDVREFVRRLQHLGLLLVAFLMAKEGVLLTGILPQATGLAPQVMTGSLLAAVYASGCAYGVRGSLFSWLAAATLPLMALTRTAAVVTLLSLPATVAPLRLRTRVLALAVLGLLSLAVFRTERFQQKMFYSGTGTLEDLSMDNPDLRSSGRFALWDVMELEIQKKRWFGHGANAQEDFIYHYLQIRGQPHNDWLRLLFDYGWFGVGLYGLSMLMQVFLLLGFLRRAGEMETEPGVLVSAAVGSFAIYALFMVTDNIFLYTSFFGNLQFAIIGVVYATVRTSQVGPAKADSSLKNGVHPLLTRRGRTRVDDAVD